jgi:hypothetical protein
VIHLLIAALLAKDAIFGEVVTAEREAAMIAAQLGVRVQVSPKLQSHLVFLVPHGASPMDQLECLASALHATVVRDHADYAIERTNQDVSRYTRARADKREELVRSTLKSIEKARELRNRLASPIEGFPQAVLEERDNLQDLTQGKILSSQLGNFYPNQLLPSEVLLEKLLDRIGLRELAEIPTGDIQVYEDRPVAGAKPLPPHDDLDQAYIEARKAYDGVELPPEVKHIVRSYALAETAADSFGPSGSLVQLRLQITADENGPQAKLEGFDSAGKRVLTASFGVQTLRVGGKTLIKEEGAKPGALWVTLRDQSAEASAYSRAEKPGPIPAWLSDPKHHEPLNLFVLDALNALAEREPSKCVAFDASDLFWPSVNDCIQENRLNLDVLMTVLDAGNLFERVESPKAEIWRPIDPEGDEQRTADRATLGRYTNDVTSEKRADLHEVGQLYFDASKQQPGSLTRAWFYLVLRANGLEFPDIPEGILIVIGSLPGVTWEQLQNQKTMSSADLSAQSQVEKFLADDRFLQVQGDAPFPDLYSHPAELYPSGFDAATPISLTTGWVPVVRIWPNNGFENKGWSSLQTLHGMFHVSSLQIQWVNGSPQIGVDRATWEQNTGQWCFRFANQEQTTVTIGLPHGLYLRYTQTGNTEQVSDVLTYQDLPQAKKDEIWKNACDSALQMASRPQNNFAFPKPISSPHP